LGLPPTEMRHRAPKSQSPAFSSREAIELVAGSGAAVDRDKLESALQKRAGRRAHHDLVGPDGLHKLIEHGLLHALRISMDIASRLRASNEHLSNMYADLHARRPTRTLRGSRRPLVNREGSMGGTAQGVVDRIDPKRGEDSRKRQLFDAPAVRLQLVDHD